MSSIKTNIISNFAGRIITTLLGIIFVPIYLKYLSVEVYGLAAFFTSIQAILMLLDFGISPTLNREVARLSVMADKIAELRSLSHTLEIVTWLSAILVGLVAALFSPLIAKYWLESKQISAEELLQSLLLMSLAFIFQWGVNFYVGGLTGLQKQVANNTVSVFIGIFRSFGAFLVLWLVSPTIQAFLIWQVISAALNAFILGILFWKSLPKSSEKVVFSIDLLKGVWQYAAGMTGISVVALILTQTDKIILSKLITLEEFGYYSLAITIVAAVINTIGGSLYNVFYPKFVSLIALNDDLELRKLYHFSSQLMSVLLIPATLMLAFFSFQVVLIWTKNPEIAEKTYLITTLCAIGTGLQALKWIPYSVQIASGITKITLYLNIGAICFLVPAMIFLTFHYGAIGGLIALIILSIVYILIGMQIMHHFLLKGELMRWYLQDVFLPFIGAFIFVSSAYYLYPTDLGRFQNFICLSFIGVIAVAFSSLLSPLIRKEIFTRITVLQRRYSN